MQDFKAFYLHLFLQLETLLCLTLFRFCYEYDTMISQDIVISFNDTLDILTLSALSSLLKKIALTN